MCSTDENLVSGELSVIFSVLIGCSIACCIVFNTRLIWLTARSTSDANYLQLSPYFISSCCADTVVICLFGPTLCILVTSKSWNIGSIFCAFLDIMFLALIWSTTASFLIYSLDRHCLLVQRRYYPETFGKSRRNTITLVVIYLTSIVTALPYLALRTAIGSKHAPMTFLFKSSMLYCILAIVILYTIPVFIIIASLSKTFVSVKIKVWRHYETEDLTRSRKLPETLTEDFQTYKGLVASSVIFILTSMPWFVFQFLKALQLNSKATTGQEIILLVILVCGVGMKTSVYVLFCGCIRKHFFSTIFASRSNEFTLEQPAVVINMGAM